MTHTRWCAKFERIFCPWAATAYRIVAFFNFYLLSKETSTVYFFLQKHYYADIFARHEGRPRLGQKDRTGEAAITSLSDPSRLSANDWLQPFS